MLRPLHDEASAGSAEDQSDDARLERLAQILGCKPEDFTSPAGDPADLVAITELLQLWLAIGSTDDRAKLLTFARELAGQ